MLVSGESVVNGNGNGNGENGQNGYVVVDQTRPLDRI